MNRAVFLDRDGVINHAPVIGGKPSSPLSLDQMEFLPGVGEGIQALNQAGFRIIVVTNQPDVANGVQTLEGVETMHRKILELFAVDAIKVCYHTDEDGCSCRKPKPGMLLEAADEWDISLEQSYMVGDRWRDVEAGRAAGCTTILVETDYDEPRAEPHAAVKSLLEASNLILNSEARLQGA